MADSNPFAKKDKDTKKAPKKESGKGPEINDPVKVDFEPNVNKMFAGMDETFEAIASGKEIPLNEIMSVAARIKRKQQIRRYKARMQIARKRSLRRRASNAVIGRRAKRGAITAVKTKLAGGRSARKLTYSERARVEKLVAKRKGLVQRRARRLLIVKRAQDRNRLFNRSRRR